LKVSDKTQSLLKFYSEHREDWISEWKNSSSKDPNNESQTSFKQLLGFEKNSLTQSIEHQS